MFHMSKKYVWYVAYGANMLKERLMTLISGGEFRGIKRSYDVCSDTSPPKDDKTILIPHGLYFGNTAKDWSNQGIAFIDKKMSNSVSLGRAYLISEEQYNHIQKQEIKSDTLMKWYGDKITIQTANEKYPIWIQTQDLSFRNIYEPSADYVDIMLEGICESYYPNVPYGKFHRVLREAIKHLGKPYGKHAAGPNTFDCSSFFTEVYTESGVCNMRRQEWRGAKNKIKAFKESNSFILKKRTDTMYLGDALFFCEYGKKGNENEVASHVGIYIGHDLMIHASKRKEEHVGSVRINSLLDGKWLERLIGIGGLPSGNPVQPSISLITNKTHLL